MKIQKLRIQNFRGLKTLEANLDGNNALFSGPNGSGKSGVIDSIEFLVKGKVTRLEGEGTGTISIAKHASHIDADPANASIEADVLLPGIAKAVTVRRTVKEPDKLAVISGDAKVVNDAFHKAQQTEFALSRREIVGFITAAPKDRLKQIQDLLNLGDIDQTRANLKTVENQFKKELKDKKQSVVGKKTELASQLGLAKYTVSDVLQEINIKRARLGAEPIAEVTPDKVKVGIIQGTATASEKLNWSQVTLDVRAIRDAVSEPKSEDRSKLLYSIDDKLAAIGDSITSARLATILKLLELAEPIVDADSDCPLCDATWEHGTLKEHLADKHEGLQATSGKIIEYQTKVEELRAEVETLRMTVQRMAHVAKSVANAQIAQDLEAWGTLLVATSKSLEGAKTALRIEELVRVASKTLLEPSDLTDLLIAVESQMPGNTTPAQQERDVWDILTKVELLVKQLDEEVSKETIALESAGRSSHLYEAFVQARDVTLQSLYDSIRDRFTVLYRFVNNEDEGAFTADLTPTEAGLDLKVDFYGRGLHPPHALHSEGHQDGMGLCLFLALAERLNTGVIEVVVLDDVMMSVDSGHRARAVDVLKSEFPQFQFVITTHETVWSKRIVQYGLVKTKYHWEFSGWTVTDGPITALVPDYLTKVYSHLTANKIDDAAALLRRSLEQEFDMICANLEGQVPYNAQHQWNLGPFKDASISRLKKLLKKAIGSAASWDNGPSKAAVQAMNDQLDAAEIAVKREAWALNPTVHHNEWATFDASELRELTDAYAALVKCFKCSKCSSYLFVAKEGNEDRSLACDCSHLNLVSKPSVNWTAQGSHTI